MESSPTDVLVLGAGPAGLALARATAEHGLRTQVIAPEPTRTWNRSFGAWEASLPQGKYDELLLTRCSSPRVYTRGDTPLCLAANYVRFGTERLQTHLLEQSRTAGVELLDDAVRELEHEPTLSHAWTQTGRKLSARVIVDATGSNSRFSSRSRKRPLGYQTAFGIWLEPKRPDLHRSMSLMDFRPLGDDGEPLTFLYSILEEDSRLFVQETALATATPRSFPWLRERLQLRLAQLGIEGRELGEVEHCLIPLGVGLPERNSPVLPFGAAAGFVHPATGYQLTHALRKATPVALALARGLAERHTDGRKRALLHAHDALWSQRERRAFQLYHLGLEVLLGLDREQTRDFMEAFFLLPVELWRGFMAGELEPSRISKTMWGVFQNSPTKIRLELLRGGVLSLFRTLTAPASQGD